MIESKKETKISDPLFQETLSGVKNDIGLTLILLVFCNFLALFIRLVFKTDIPIFIFIILLFWILLYLFHNYFIQTKKDRHELSMFHFKNTIVDIFFLTIIIYYLGGAEWIGPIFYITILSWTNNVLYKKQSFVLAFLAVAFYSALVLLEYFQILPHREVFGPSSGYYQNLSFVLVQISVLAGGLFFITENYGNFSELFNKKQEKLINIQEEVEEAKDVLEIRVKARTRELKELSDSLEDQVKKRTKEIVEKMEELEKFRKLAVGRELKMIELKKEIIKLKSKPKNKIKV